MVKSSTARSSAEKIHTNLQLIGPEQAKSWIEIMRYKHQRKLRSDHVAMLAEEMRDGRFVQGTAIRIARLGDASYLIDGQHRLNAVVKSGRAQLFTAIYECVDNEAQLAEMYGRHDVGMRRSASDMYRAIELPESLGLPSDFVNSYAAAMSMLIAGMGRPEFKDRTRANVTEVIHLMELYAPSARSFIAAISGAERIIQKPLRRAYVIGVGVLSFRYSAAFAEERNGPDVTAFWRGVARDDRVPSSDPRKFVNRHLMTTTLTSAHNANGERSIVNSQYAARYVAHAFNAYMARETRKVIKVVDPTAPLTMYGVPKDPALWLV